MEKDKQVSYSCKPTFMSFKRILYLENWETEHIWQPTSVLHIHAAKYLRLRNAAPNLDLQWLNFTSVFHFPCPDFSHIDQIYNKPTTCQSQPHLFTLQATAVPETYIWALSVSSQVSDSLSTQKAPGEQKLTHSSCRPLSPQHQMGLFLHLCFSRCVRLYSKVSIKQFVVLNKH